jgi:hypothetical protein
MFFIWLVMPTNVGKQHLPSRMNRRLCGSDRLVAIAESLAALDRDGVPNAIQVRGSYCTNALQKRCSSSTFVDHHPQLHVPRIPREQTSNSNSRQPQRNSSAVTMISAEPINRTSQSPGRILPSPCGSRHIANKRPEPRRAVPVKDEWSLGR